ncbi:uncharacterized protein LOC141877949 isoform X2 [Acropora palmata]|uniref:uncharacterized protein LOC141877949 isoform X2 n=1 Tax=Acropora palmata TaxID=6131 RepID=UPI003DA062D6
MEEARNRYILLHDRVGQILERSLLSLATKLTPTQLLKGELLEALPKNEQPDDPKRIVLGGINRKLRVECHMDDVMKLTVQEADLLLPILSTTLRYQICLNRKLLDFGKRLAHGSLVLVSIKGYSKKLPGVVWFKGELLNSPGTMFGIELHRNPGFGTCDGTFRNKQYFKCAPDSGVFVGLDKLAPLEDDNSELRIPSKRDGHDQVNLKSRLDSFIPSFFKGKSDLRFPQPRYFDSLKIDQRVVTFRDKGIPLRGTVRFTGDAEDSSGHVQSVVGLELDESYGCGTGKWEGHQVFVCKRDYAYFVDIENIMLEEDFDRDAERAKKKATSQKQDKQLRDIKVQERRHDTEIPTRSLSYNVQCEASDRACKGSVRRSNSFNSAVIIAAGESSKTDSIEFIEKQQQLLDDYKKCPTSDEEVTMNDDERTDGGSFNLNFDDKYFQNSPPPNQPITQPGFSEAAYSEYVKVGKDGKEEAWKSYSNVGEYDEQFEENASSGQSTSLQQALEDLQQLKNENNKLNLAKCQLEKEKNDVQEENNKLVFRNNSLQTDLRAKETQVHELETSLTTAQQALKGMQQLKILHKRLKLEKCQLEKEKNAVREEKDELVVQNNSLQTDLRAKETQVHELETSLTTAQQALEDTQQLKILHKRLKLEKCQLEKEKNAVREEKDELVVQNNSLQTDLRAKETQVHELETSLTTAQQALEDTQQLKILHKRLKLEKCQLEKEKNAVREEKDELVVQNNSLQTDLGAKETQVHELETSLTTAQQALKGMQTRKILVKILQFENCQLEKEKNDVREEKDELVVENNSLQTNLRAKEAQVQRLETTLATAQRALEECQQIKESCDWVVYRDEVQITDKCLGVGGWGKVSLGTFRGCKVAVKEIHELILSPYNRRLFEREMNIAARCRHPCLLQFIGATNDDEIPLFITELLDKSLRALLEERQLADTEISIISLDVSLALNYLHNMKPSPILHRDVSSANVLLWRQGNQWRGKVSDYGTAKFVQQTMTRAPGAVIYSAPEAVSSNQTPKVDVYSFGVLLCEMCIRQMPEPQRRHQQVLLVKSHDLRNLVCECVQDNPAERPEMSEIIKKIERFEG